MYKLVILALAVAATVADSAIPTELKSNLLSSSLMPGSSYVSSAPALSQYGLSGAYPQYMQYGQYPQYAQYAHYPQYAQYSGAGYAAYPGYQNIIASQMPMSAVPFGSQIYQNYQKALPISSHAYSTAV